MVAETASKRLAVVCSHPIQYYAPWFRYIASTTTIDLKVFYLHDPRHTHGYDPGFQRAVAWDIDLLTGYANEFVPNRSLNPNPSSTFGLINPGLFARIGHFDPDALLMFGYGQATLAFTGLFSRWPLILRGDSHFLAGPNRSDSLRTRLRTRILRRAGAHLSVGEANRQWLLSHHVDPRRIFRCPHAVDQDRFRTGSSNAETNRNATRARLGISPDAYVVGFAGKLEDKKQPLMLIEAFQSASIEAANLLMVGSGPLLNVVNELCSNDDRINHVPFANQSEMPGLLSAMDVIVLPSFGAYETWGLVINEAQTLGVPCIVSNHVGCHLDLVVPGETGLVFPAGDRDALVASLIACADKDLRARMSVAAARHSSAFSYAATMEGLASALERVSCPD